MYAVPQRLLDLASVQVHIRSGNFCLLEKRIDQAVTDRKSYLSQAAFSLVIGGEQRLIDEQDRHHRVIAGRGIFLNKGLYTLSDLVPARGPFHSLIFFFPLEWIQHFVQEYGNEPSSEGEDHCPLVPGKDIWRLAQQLINRQKEGAALSQNYLRIKTQELLHLLQESGNPEAFGAFINRVARQPRRNLREFMESHYDKSLKVEDFASLTGRSLSTFRRDFQRTFQCSPNKWLKQKRLAHAENLLLQTGFEVREVAQASGFSNPSYFIAEFRKQFGSTPVEFRKERA